MSGVQISVTSVGLSGIRNRLAGAKGRIFGETSLILDQAIDQAKRTVQAGTPVRTGRAQQGWTTQHVGPLERRLYNPVFYVPFLVLGTRYMNPSVTLNVALDRATKDMERTLATTGSRLAPLLIKGY